jgi:hypothetical protein
MSVSVHNMYHLPNREIPAGDSSFVYIGRPKGNAPLGLGNPFKVGPDYKQGEAVLAFKAHISKEWANPNSSVRVQIVALARRAQAGEDIKLVCWCKPKACHGDVIKEAIDNLVARWEIKPLGPTVDLTVTTTASRKRSP